MSAPMRGWTRWAYLGHRLRLINLRAWAAEGNDHAAREADALARAAEESLDVGGSG